MPVLACTAGVCWGATSSAPVRAAATSSAGASPSQVRGSFDAGGGVLVGAEVGPGDGVGVHPVRTRAAMTAAATETACLGENMPRT